MMNHTSQCSDPTCLCFYCKLFFESEKGIDSGKSARLLYSQVKGAKSMHTSQGLVVISDQRFIEQMRIYRSQVITVAESGDPKSFEVKHLQEPKPDQVEYFVNLEDEAAFANFLSSYFCKSDFTDESINQFEAVFSLIRFLTFACQGPLAGLVLGYNYQHSTKNDTNRNIYSDILLKRLLVKKKQLLMIEELKTNLKTRSQPHSLNFQEVLQFRKKSQTAKAKIQELIYEKIEFYKLLHNQTIDFPKMMKLGNGIYEDIQMVTKDLDKLMQAGGLNVAFIRDALFFELCVLEKTYLSSKLRKKYKDMYTLSKHNSGSITSTNSRSRFNPFSSSNVMVCLKKHHTEFKIDYSTQNTTSLLGTELLDVKGMNINQFMPKMIADVHDEFILNFLNGVSNSEKNGRILTNLITKKGTIKSIIILPRIECLLSDSVMVGGLLALRNKNKEALVCTDQLGNIQGANSSAQKLLALRPSATGSSILLNFPGILPLIFPDFNSEKYIKMSTIASRTERQSMQLGGDPEAASKFANLQIQHRQTFVLQTSASQKLHTLKSEITTAKTSSMSITQQNLMMTSNLDQLQADNFDSKVLVFLDKISESLKKAFVSADPIMQSAKVCLERFDYQRGITLLEISADNIHTTDPKIKNYFRNLAANSWPHFFAMLGVQPQALTSAYKLCITLQNLQTFTSLFQKKKQTANSRLFSRFNSELKYLEGLVKESEAFEIDEKSRIEPGLSLNPQKQLGDRQLSEESISQPANPTFGLKPDADATPQVYSFEIKQTIEEADNLLKNEGLNFEDQESPDHMRLANTLRNIQQLRAELVSMVDKCLIFDLMVGVCGLALQKYKAESASDKLPLSGVHLESDSLNRILQQRPASKHLVEQNNPKDADKVSAGSLERSTLSPRFIFATYQNEKQVGPAQNPHDLPSTILNSSVRSTSSGGEANLIRFRISNSSKSLSFRRLEITLYILFVVSVVAKLTFRSRYASAVNSIFEYEVNTNKYANLLRPSSFIYREASKGIVSKQLQVNTASFPNNSIFFYSQLEHYRDRLAIQVDEIFTYVDKKLETPFSFDSNAAQMNKSLFTLGYLLFYHYRLMFEELTTKSKLVDIENLSTCVSLATAIYDLVMKVFLNQAENKRGYLRSMTIFFYLDFSCNVEMGIILTFLIVVIYKSIYQQARYASELLLKIEKSKFKKAILQLTKSLAEVDQQKFGSKDPIEDAVYQKSADGKYIPIPRSKSKQQKGQSKENILFKDQTSPIGSYSIFVGYPSRYLLKFFIKITAVYLMINGITVYNFSTRLKFFETLTESLQSSADLNLCSSSFYFIQASFDRHLYEISTGKNSTGTYLLGSTTFNDALANIDRFKSMNEDYLFSLVSKTNICDLAKKIIHDENKKKTCLYITEGDQNLTIYKALMLIEDDYEMNLLNFRSNPTSPAAYFESEAFLKFETTAFYLTIALKSIGTTYMNRILQMIESNSGRANIFTSIFLSLMGLTVVVFKLWWLPRQIRWWKKIQSVLLVMNDDIISNMYLKSYFMNKRQ